MTRPLPASDISNLLEYDASTGMFRWKNPTVRQAKGWFRGNHSVREYRRLYIAGRHYMAHDVAWALMTGYWPCGVDHRNRDQADNRWSNLREATQHQNMRNRNLSKNNSTGVHGVSRFGNKYRMQLQIDGRKIHIGLYDSLEDAAVARRDAERAYFGEFASCASD